MKKKLALLLAVCIVAVGFTLTGCGQKTQPANESASTESTPAESSAAAESIASPVTEYESLDEINEITEGKLSKPAVMGVTDESYCIVDCGDYKIAQYEFAANGAPYTFRFANGVVEDISGIYDGDDTLFAASAENSNEYKDFDGGKAGRYFTLDGQYVLSIMDGGEMDMDTFQSIADELFSMTDVQDDYNYDADAFNGDWHEEIAGRGMMSVTAADGYAEFTVDWANSAAETISWKFAGSVDENCVINYTDGVKISTVYDEYGNGTETVLSKENSGTVSINEDGNILWIDNESENEEGSVFVKNE